MATIKVRINVEQISNVLLQFDQIMVFRSATENGTYTEITGIGTRIELVAGQSLYEYIDDAAPANTYWYRTRYYNSSTLAESSSSAPRQGLDAGVIVSISDIRAEGLTVEELSDDRALFLIQGWQDWFQHKTGNFFTSKEMTLDLDGTGCRVIWLNFPIISVDELYINGDFDNAVDASYYSVYNRRFPEDDRKNPRIKLTRGTRSVFTSVRNYVFEAGDLNQRVVGTFGYVEEDGSAPFAVRRAITQLVVLTANTMTDGEVDALIVGRKIEEVTDRHRIRYSDLWDQLQLWKPTGIEEVDGALMMYMRPAKIHMARSFITQ